MQLIAPRPVYESRSDRAQRRPPVRQDNLHLLPNVYVTLNRPLSTPGFEDAV